MEGRNVGDEAKGKGSVVESWLIKHGLLYAGATRHPFILSIRDGTVEKNSLKRWLAEDYIFVRAFVPFVASVLVKASKLPDNTNDIDLILGGLASLRDEIAWFKKQAYEWDVSLADIVPREITVNYCRFLESLMSSEVEYAVAITAFWAIETVYQNCFAHCIEDGSQASPELKETFERWGSSEFSQYCSALRIVAERCLEDAPNSVRTKAEVTFLDVLEHEVEFWNMSNEHA